MGDLEQVTQSDELTAQIIAKFDVDNTMTKAWAKKNLAADMKQIGFEFAWKNATEQRPMLKKPGPRGPRK